MIDGWGPPSKHPEALKLSEKIKVMKPKMARALGARGRNFCPGMMFG